MAHKMTVKVSPALLDSATGLGEDKVLSEEAAAIHEQFVAEGKITSQQQSNENTEDGSYTLTTIFVDSATADEFLAAMANINEYDKSGSSRSEHTREDI
jgi:hypothetical protein